MAKLEITFNEVSIPKGGIKLGLDKDGDLITNLSINCKTHSHEIARVLNMLQKHMPLFLVVGSNQAEMDLKIDNIDPATGQSIAAKKNVVEQAAAILEHRQTAGAVEEKGAAEKEIGAQFKDLPKLDLSTFKLTVGKDKKPHIAVLAGQEYRSEFLKEVIMKTFAGAGIDCPRPDQLIDVLRTYEPSTQRDEIIDILGSTTESPNPDLTKTFPKGSPDPGKNGKHRSRSPRKRKDAPAPEEAPANQTAGATEAGGGD